MSVPQRRLMPLPGPEQDPVPVFPGYTVTLDDLRLFVRRTPPEVSDPDVGTAVYVHGLGGSAANWTDLMHCLSRRMRGMAVDLPGFGYSPPPPDGRIDVDVHVDAVARLIEANGAGPAHVFGNSMGGAVVTLLAARRPDLVRTVTLVAPALPSYRALSGHAYLFAGLLEPLRRRLPGDSRPLMGSTAEEFAASLTELVYADPDRMHPLRRADMAREIRRRVELPYVRDAFTGSMTSMLRGYLPGPGNLWRAARRVDAPTLAVLGSADRLVDVGIAGRIARHFEHSRVVIESDLGHVPQMERPAAVAAVVADRLDELADAATESSG